MDYSYKITIIIPVYNTALYLLDCFESILSQSFKDIEILCVDDGSTDDSYSILLEYEKLDPRVKVFKIAHGGQSMARNRALREAKGKYIYFMDSDDLLSENAFSTMYLLAEERNLDILYFDGTTFIDDESIEEKYRHLSEYYIRPIAYSEVMTGIEMFTKMSVDNVYRVSPCLQLIRHDYLASICVSFYEGIIHEDNIFTFKCMMQAKRVSHENAALFNRRFRASSTMTGLVSYRNFYGYFICWYQILAFIADIEFPQATKAEVSKLLQGYHSLAIECGKQLPDSEILEALDTDSPILREIYFSSFHTFICKERLNEDSLTEKAQPLEKEINDIKASASYRFRMNKTHRVARLAHNEYLAFCGLKKHIWIRRKNLHKAPLRVYWWNKVPNFGDLITPEIIKSIFGYDCIWAPPEYCNLAGAGSIIAHIVDGDRTCVWGSGLIEDGPNVQSKLLFCAVRGTLTLNRIGEQWSDVALGDPGLLANLVYKVSGKKTDKIGVVPHYVDKDLPIIDKMSKDDRFSIFNVTDPPSAIAEQISQCKLVLSSSLHGLIFSDSFKIPNIHIKLSDGLMGGVYKFQDYYSSIGRVYTNADLEKIFNDDYLDRIQSEYKPIKTLKKIQRRLIRSFPY